MNSTMTITHNPHHHQHTHRAAPKIYYRQLIYNQHHHHTGASRARRHGHYHHHPRKSGNLKPLLLALGILILLVPLLLQVVLARVSKNQKQVHWRRDDGDGDGDSEWTRENDDADQAKVLARLPPFGSRAENVQAQFATQPIKHSRPPPPPPHNYHQTHAIDLQQARRSNIVQAHAQAQAQASQAAKHRYGNRKQISAAHSERLSVAGRRLAQQAAAAAAKAGPQRSKRHNSARLNNNNNNGGPGPSGGGNSFPLDSLNAADRPVVATSKGLVKGITQKIFTGKFVDAFLGIPFGQPPVGRYRFRHPQPVQPWQDELDASRMSNSCYQVNDTFFGANFGGTSIWNANTPLDENCLQLNIWTPFATANTVPVSNTPSASAHGGPNTSSSSSSSSTANRFARTGPGLQGGGRPVLVWIFGGGFYSGTPTLSLYEGGAMASEEDLIVVSINYRVSALGFLYFGRPDAPGNAGLFDQLLALQWIQDEIGQFGGDPRRVTIFGESAGAVSVAFHLLSPLSRNLFSQAILQSGAATCPWGHMEAHEIMANGFQLAGTLGCPGANSTSNVDAVIECLLDAHPMALVSQEVGQTQSSVLNFPFVPVVDGAFLLEPPAESLAKGNFKPARLLLGSNNDEGNAFLIYMPEFSHCPGSSSATTTTTTTIATTTITTGTNSLLEPTLPFSPASGMLPDQQELVNVTQAPTHHHLVNGEGQQKFDDDPLMGIVVRRSFPAENNTNKQAPEVSYQQNESKPCKPNEDLQLARNDFIRLLREDLNPYAEHPLGKRAIVFEYSNWINPMDPVSNYDALDKIVGDYYFTCHVNEFGLRYAQAGNPVYMYYFKQRSSISPWPKWMGVIHADEINFVFGEPLNPAFNYTRKEVDLSRRMMKYWANFARFGNPTPNGQQQESQNLTTGSDQWPEYLPDRRQYFELHSEYIRVGRGPRAKQCAFWSHYLPQLLRTYGKNNQCHPKFSPSSSSSSSWSRLKSPFTSGHGGGTGSGDDYDDYDGLQEDDKAAMSLHRPRQARPSSGIGLLASIPSFISFSLFVIVLLAVIVLVAATGHSFYTAKLAAGGGGAGRRLQVPGWLAGVWPRAWGGRGAGGGGGGSQPTSAPNNHGEGDQGDEAAGDPLRPPSSSRGGNAAT